MGLYDVLDDIAARQVTKTETGDNRIFGVVLGLVTKNYDKNMPGRVCVAIPSRDKDANELLWARVAMPSSGKDWGHYFLPEVGDQVLLVFEQGNIERPYIIGCIPKTADGFLKKQVDEKNQFKAITTKHGSTITFEDNAEDKKGKKDKISKGDIVGFLCKKGGLVPGEVGRIDVSDRYAYAAVKREKLQQVIRLTRGEKIKGIKTIVEEVR